MSLITRRSRDLDWPELRMWPGWMNRWSIDWPESLRDLMDHTQLKVEEFRENGQLVVRAEMPGINPEEDVDITVSDHTLHLRAERSTEKTSEDTKSYRSEFSYGSFSRSIPLPAGTDADKVAATYTDGILEVRIPINAAEATAQKVRVRRG